MSAAQPLPTKSRRSAGRYRREVMERRMLSRGERDNGHLSMAVVAVDRAAKPHGPAEAGLYLRCLPTSLVISNMLTFALPPNTSLSASSALICRRFFASCSLFFLMYAQSFFVT